MKQKSGLKPMGISLSHTEAGNPAKKAFATNGCGVFFTLSTGNCWPNREESVIVIIEAMGKDQAEDSL